MPPKQLHLAVFSSAGSAGGEHRQPVALWSAFFAWNIVTSPQAAEARNFGRTEPITGDERQPFVTDITLSR